MSPENNRTSTNYVIAAYLGDRRNPDERYDAYRGFFLREHVASLHRLDHSLAQITIVCSGGDPDGICKSFPSRIGTANVEIIMRPNVGMSYGAWSDVFERYRTNFSHYIFTEDDYIFTQNNFDDELLGRIESLPRCGMFGGAVYTIHGDRLPHMAIFVAMCRSEALEAARRNSYSDKIRLPYDDSSSSIAAGYFGQTSMSYAIVDAGYELNDWLDMWSSAYWDSFSQRLDWFGRGENGDEDPLAAGGNLACPSFIAPIQAMDKKVPVWDRKGELFFGSINRDGSFVKSTSVP